jgi:ketosteroid isomerase-like protein
LPRIKCRLPNTPTDGRPIGIDTGKEDLRPPVVHSPEVTDTVESNVARTRRWYEEWNREGLPGFERVWAPDIVLHEASEFPETGVFRGAEELSRHVSELIEDGGHFKMVPVTIEGRGEYVLASIEVSVEGPSSGAAVTTPFFQVMLYRDGRLIELRDFLDGDEARGEYERLSSADR